ncbi:hypothetical protein AAFC00_003838 [Neodothiora populina]|uniref:Nucleolar protein 12 n=1 Tax=Neodothiora populina TaxID=2781224 RepID=A0ABR3PG02_9PEZI
MPPSFKVRKGGGKGGNFKSKNSKSSGGRPKPVEELKFDPAARQDYLTGFHKRKLQRIKHAQEENAKKEREERVVHRREIREERKRDLEAHVAEVNAQVRAMNPDMQDSDAEEGDGEDGEWDGITEETEVHVVKPDGVDEYVDEDKFTTVTIETMDDDPRKWNGDDGEEDKAVETAVVEETEEVDDGTKKKRVWTKEKPKKKFGDKVKKPKFRYESKAERQQTRNKQRAKNSAAAKARKEK